MQVFDEKGKSIQLGSTVGRGGEAIVYRVGSRSGLLAKIYEPAPRANYPHKLSWMLDHPPANPTRANNHPSLAWPAGLIYDQERKLVGYLMPYIQGAVPALDVFNPRRRARILPSFDRRYLHRTARNLAAALGALHSSGYVVGDLNESNVLVTPSAMVTLIDTDSFQVEERRDGHVVLHFCPVGKGEYTPPELQGKQLAKLQRLPEQDSFGLGVLIFQLLMQGNHPFRAQWLAKGDPPPIEERIAKGGFPYISSPAYPVLPPKNARDLNYLHPKLAELVRRCFIDGHHDASLRPTPSMWEYGIAEAEQALVICPRGHVFSNHLSACPHCPSPAKGSTSRSSDRPRTANPAQPRAQGQRGQTAQPGKQNPTNRWGWWTGNPNPGVPSYNTASANPTRPAQGGPVRPSATGQAASSAGPTPGRGNPATQAGSHPPRPAASTSKPASSGPASTPNPTSSRPSSGTSSPRPNPAASTQVPPNWRGWWVPRPAWQSGPAGSAGIPWGSGRSGRTPSTRPANPARSVWTRTLNRVRVPTSRELLSWAQPRLVKSLAVGAGLGALAGAVPAAAVGGLTWAAGEQAPWILLWALGGAAGGLLRGWRPSYRLSQWIRSNIGWQRFWPLLGMLVGGFLGGVVTLVFLWWLIFPVFLGMFFGGRAGLLVGRKIWQSGAPLGWERLWAAGGVLAAGVTGFLIARWAGASGLGTLADQLTGQMIFWLTAHQVNWTLIWVAIGASAGALGGAIGGFFSDLIARFVGLID